MDANSRLTASDRIVRRLEGMLHSWSSRGVVLLYAALSREANLRELVSRCPDFSYLLPRVVAGRESLLELREVTDWNQDLAPGAYGIEEPLPQRCPLVSLDAVDLVLVPGMAFTPRGHRLGKGGGYYDRLLGHPEFRARRVGVCFDCQIVEEIEVEEHDEPVDVVVTEERVFGSFG